MLKKFRSIVVSIILPVCIFAESVDIQTVQAANHLIAALEGREAPESLLPYMMEIARNGHNLPLEQRLALEQYRFDFSREYVIRSRPQLSDSLDFGEFRLHYTTTGSDSISTNDTSGVIGIPDYLETVAAAFERTYYVEIDSMQFTRPPSDINTSGSNHYDIYILNLSPIYYALTWADEFVRDNNNSSVTEINAWTSYIEIRNDYSGFPNTEEENIQVTAAHEFFHSIQFGYDGWDIGDWEPNELWLLESTAVLMEEIVFDWINDCYQYMPGWFSRPYLSLDLGTSHAYGSFIFFQYIFEHLGGYETIRRVFERSIEHDSYLHDYSHLEINEALEEVNSSFQEALNNMVVANLIMSSSPLVGEYSYEEADDYPLYNLPPIQQTINYLSGDTLTIHNNRLNRFASQYFKINTFTPVLVSLTNLSGPPEDLNMLAILEKFDGSYKIESGDLLNINADFYSIHLAVVSQDTNAPAWDFKLFIAQGDSNDYIIPKDFEIAAIYPGPFNSQRGPLTIKIANRYSQKMRVKIYDLIGNEVITLNSSLVTPPGIYLYWNGRSSSGIPVPSGIYIISAIGERKQSGKLITLIK